MRFVGHKNNNSLLNKHRGLFHNMFKYLDAPETALNGRAVRGLLRDKQKIKLLCDAQRKNESDVGIAVCAPGRRVI